MKKNVKKSLISLALCGSVFCVVGGVMPFMNKTDASAAAAYYTLDGFMIDETAAIRSKEPNGIRFTTNLSAETKSAIEGLVNNPTYGTLLLPADMLGSGELTHKTAKAIDSVANIWIDSDSYTAVLAGKENADGTFNNLPDSYYNRPIAARSYVTGKDDDGNTVTYYSENTAVRSIGYVAYMAKLDGNTNALVGAIADQVKVELAFNDDAQISYLNSVVEGTAVIENKYEASTDSAAVITIGGIPLSAELMAEFGATISYSTSAPGVVSVDGSTLTAVSNGSATITASAMFNGQMLAPVTKTVSTNLYKAESEYKILISKAAASGLLNSQTNYVPAQSQAAYEAYYKAFEKTAAYKMQKILQEATGVQLEITTEVVPGGKYISIGETALGSASALSVAKDTGSEVMVDSNGNIIICGNTEQGTLYGVQNLLGELVGYEYFMEDTYVVNNNVEVVLDGNKSYEPSIAYNVLQGDLERFGVMDDYAMQMYTEQIIPVGTTDEEDANGYFYKGVAHNSVLVVNNGTYNAADVYTDAYIASGYLYSSAKNKSWQKWYATYKKLGIELYYTLSNPYPGVDHASTTINENVDKIFAELCYTAHGDNTQRGLMIDSVVNQMYAKMQKFPTLVRLGFAHMDHRYWCECDSCKAAGNPSDNLLLFLLDVADKLEDKLAAAGDARAETFRICSLFYHATNQNPKNTANYASKLQENMKHVEVWAAESGADMIDPYKLTDAEKNEISKYNSNNNWNATVYSYMEAWANICNTYDAKLFFWVYYANTTSFFIPFDTFNAIRVNYGAFEDLGVDYVFNQMMESKQNWSRFKEFLMSKLIWNAKPTDAEWDGWYDEYFEGAYGPGAEAMRSYFDAWQEWTVENVDEFRRDDKWAVAYQDGASMGVDMRDWDHLLSEGVLEGWIECINDALDALDVSDPKYDTYRRNIMLEKLTPMYLLMWMCDGYEPVMQTGEFDYLIDASKTGTFASTTYVNKYGAEFLTWIEEWDITYDGEGSTRVMKPFLDAIKAAGISGGDISTNVAIQEKQYVQVGTAVEFNNLALGSATYTVSGGVSGTVTAKAGAVTLNTNTLRAGQSYTLVFTNTETGATVTFTDVVAATTLSATAGAVSTVNGYYYVAKDYYVELGATQLLIAHNAMQKGEYDVTVNGVNTKVNVYSAGNLSVNVGEMNFGDSCEVICVDANNNTFIFNVVCAKFIRTVEDLKAIGVGGWANVMEDGSIVNKLIGKDSKLAGNDTKGCYVLANDIDFAGASFTPGHNYGASNFMATFDGNGYTISNITVGDSGIFGGLKDATIKNVNFEGVTIDITQYYPGWNYGALLANAATNTTIQNVNATFVKLKVTPGYNDPNGSTVKYHWGLLIANGSKNVFYNNVTMDVTACENKLYSIFGSNVESMLADNVKVIMTQSMVDWMQSSYGGIIYGYTDSKETKMTTAIDGVTIVTKNFAITNTEKTVGLGGSLVINTNQSGYNYTYSLKDAVAGVSISGNTVTVAKTAKLGETFTVVVKEASQGLTKEITFTIAKAAIALSDVVTIEQVNGSFLLPNEIEGDILSVTLDGYVFNNVSGLTVTFGANDLVKQEYLGKGKMLLVETATSVYEVPANVYTMIIDNKAEFDTWETVAANNSVKAGVVIEEQKYAYLTGYFVLGTDIAYNGVWTPALTYASTSGKFGTLYGLCNKTNSNVLGWIDQYGADKVIAVNGWTDANKLGFHGTFDGDGYVIDGMRTEGKYSAFTVILGVNGAFKNLAFTNASVGAGAALLFNRGSGSGSGTLENIYVEIVSMESGSGDDATTVYGLNGQSAKNVKNVIVDASKCDFTGVTGAYLVDVGPAVADGVYVIGANGLATTIKNITTGDVAASFASMEALLNDATHGAVVSAFDSSFWTVDAEISLVVPNRLYASRAAVELSDTIVIEKWNNNSFVLPEEVKGTVVSVQIGNTTLTDINGRTVTIGENDFVAQTELGKGKPVFITTEAGRNYTGYANVYTMIIDSKAELDKWQEVASENAVKAGDVLAAQKGLVYNGYFLLNADIEYNGVWKPYKAYGALWGLCYSNANIKDASGNYVAGAIVEDWGKGEKAGFKGVFDGNGHYISGMETSGEYSAFVVTMGGGTIKNVAFTNAVIGSQASLVVDRGTGSLENVYVQVKSMSSGTYHYDEAQGKMVGDATTVLFRNYNSYIPSSIKNVLVDVSMVDYASLKSVYIASFANHACNLYVIGMPEGVEFSATTTPTGALVFQHYNPNSGNVADFDLANCFTNVAALLNDETYGADVKAWSNGIWNVTYKNEIFFGDLMVYDGLETVELDDVVEFSVEGGKLSLPATIEGTVTSVELLGTQIFAGMDGNKVLLDCAEIATDYMSHGVGKNIIITTDVAKYVLKANVITKFIKTADDLKALGVGNNRTNTEDILGYYVLGNDITFEHASDYSDVVTAGYPLNGDYYFKATFDGRGYTLYNMRVSDGGIFGLMRGGTVKNLNLKNVYLTDDIPAGISTQNGGYMAIFAYSAPSTVFENINITIASSPNEWSWKRDGLIVNSSNWGAATYRDITIDATGLKLKTLLGTHYNDSNVYENVVIKAADYVAIGYTADSYNNGVQNTAALMSEFPAGVTFERAYLITDCAGKVLPLYTGDVTSLGFPAGTEVRKLTYPGTTNAWDGTMGNAANKVFLRKAADQDYASIQFVLGRDFAGSEAFFTWVHYMSNGTKVYKGGGQINKNGTYSLHSEATSVGLDLSYLVFETNTGAPVTASNPMKAGVAYTLYAYCTNLVDVELAVYDQSGSPMTIYFANISSGYVTELAEEVVIGIEDGNFALPTGVEGTVKSVMLNDKDILTSIDGGKIVFDKSLMPTDKAQLGAGKKILIYTDVAVYEVDAAVATQIIRTTQELRDLGVGGKVYTDRKPTYNNSDSTDEGAGGNANSDVAGNDKLGYYLLGNDLDFTGEQSVAAGYSWHQSWFKGTFDGNGHTIYNISVNEGGIFGSMRGATIKNVNFVGVVYNINLGIYAGQYSQQTALFAHVSDSSTFENINVKVDSVIPGSFGWATLAYTFWNTNMLTNINIDASGIALSSVLGSDNQSKVSYSNVTITAKTYSEIGQKGGVALTEWPAGVTYIERGALSYVPTATDSAALPVYTGDVMALGFAAGTTVYEQVQDNRTNMWAAGTNLSLSMEKQRIRITKGLNEDYASVWFSLSKTTATTQLFFTWYLKTPDGLGEGNRPSAGVYFMKDGTSNSNEGFSAEAYDMDGKKVTNVVAGQVYELRWYDANHISYGFEFGCCQQLADASETPVTVYYANPSTGNSNPVTPGNSNKSLLYSYMGDETALGFAEGTDVYYELQDNRPSGWGAVGELGLNMEQQTVVITKDANEEYASIQFVLSRELAATGSIFTAWYGTEAKENNGLCGDWKADGSYTNSISDTISDFKVEVYDMDGNKVTGTLQANTVYEMRWYGTGINRYKIGCLEANSEYLTIYWANPSSSNNA